MHKKRGKHTFVGKSKNLLFALLVVAAAVTVYGIAQAAVVSHEPSEITPQGPGSGLDSDTLWGLNSADILAQVGSGGGGENIYYLRCGVATQSRCRAYWESPQNTITCTPPSCAAIDASLGTGCIYNNLDIILACNVGQATILERGASGYCERACMATNAVTQGAPATGATLIYTTKSAYNGNLGGRNGADSKCSAQLPSELSGKVSNIHAFLTASATDEIRDMHTSDSDSDGAKGSYETSKPVYGYNRYWAKWTKLALEWQDLLDGSIMASLGAATGMGTNFNYWTGSASSGNSAADVAGNPSTCAGWQSSTSTKTTITYEGEEGSYDASYVTNGGLRGSSQATDGHWLTDPMWYPAEGLTNGAEAKCSESYLLICAAKYTG